MHVFDTIYLYDENDKQYEAQVREINTRAVGVKYNRLLDRAGRVDTQILATIMRGYNDGDRRIEIRNDVLQRDGWQWSTRPVPAIRKGALVVIKNWHRTLQVTVHGLVPGPGGAHADSFAFEGVKAYRRTDPYDGSSDLGKFKGHRFTASTDCVQEILKNGKGRRLLLGPFMTDAESRKFFGY